MFHRHNVVLSFALILFLQGNARGDIEIPYSCRVPNEEPGYCAWASLETLGNFLRIKELYGLKESRKKDPPYPYRFQDIVYRYDPPHFGTVGAIHEKLNKLGVKHKVQGYSYDTGLIVDSLNRGLGCVIAVRHGLPTTEGCHAEIVTGFGDWGYTYVDTNEIAIRRYIGSKQWFCQEWTGFVLVVYPSEEK